jgi:signal transduction histidine kinase
MTTHAPLRSRWTKAESVYHVQVTGDRDNSPVTSSKDTRLKRVFEAFYTTKPEGMGMGLSISRSIIEAHGGRLWPVAHSGYGATFEFTLPTEGGSQPV